MGSAIPSGPPKISDFWVSYCSLVGDSISVPFPSPPESSARMGSAESEVGSTAAAAGHFAFPADNIGSPKELRSNGESGGLGRPLIKWSGNQPCAPSAERDSPTLYPQPFSGRDLEIALRIWRLRPPVRPSLLRRYFFGIACPKGRFHKRLRAFQVALKGCSISTYARSK